MTNIDNNILERAKLWLSESFDDETVNEVKRLIENDPINLIDAFYKDLEFGTGGLRGIMGVGTNRMNIYTVAMATQGLVNYLIKMFPKDDLIKVAIAYDSRNNNKTFANITADVFSANGIKVYLFEDIRPTPELSFAISHFGCRSGVVITASHNPKEYNGYKAYWDDGAQMVNPHDENVIKEVRAITNIGLVKMQRNEGLIEIVGDMVDKIYIERLKSLSLNPDIIKKNSSLTIVYSPLHGSGVNIVPESLKSYGFTNIVNVKEQCVMDGNFPTIKSPNPEEKAALTLALEKAREVDAALVLATDPDADRVGVAIRNDKGDFVLLNGNQTASILIYYILSQWKAKGKLKGKEFIVKTIVTSELLKEIADGFEVECYDVLTGFKFIAEVIRQNEGVKQFIAGGEESYGYLVGDFVRDKDAVVACCFIAEAAAWAKENGLSLYELLIDIYLKNSFYKESLLSLERKGKTGSEEIQAMMLSYRNNPPKIINGIKLLVVKDYLLQKEINLLSGDEKKIEQPKSDVLQFVLEDGSKITVRPSGTEPKIKFYFGVKTKLVNRSEYETTEAILDAKINGIINSMNLR